MRRCMYIFEHYVALKCASGVGGFHRLKARAASVVGFLSFLDEGGPVSG